MPDAMDRVQQHAQDLNAAALTAHAQRPVVAGRVACINLDCGQPIASARTALGAVRCVECQTEHESRDAHFAAWGRR